MTQQDDITQRVLTDDEIRGEIHNAIGFGFEPGELQSVNADDLMTVAHGLLSKVPAPVADSTLRLEQALHELVDKIVPGLDTGDLVQDARRASTALSATLASAPVAGHQPYPALPEPDVTHPGEQEDSYSRAAVETAMRAAHDRGYSVGWDHGREQASAPVAGADRDADERAVMTPAKAAYVEHFGHAAGWLSYKGSWFIEGFKAGQKSAPVAGEAQGWSGWACQYPNKLPRLYGAKEIAQLNCDAANGDRVLFLSEHAAPQASAENAPGTGEPFMYGIMGPDGKAHLDEFCVSADPAELEQEVVAHMNEDHKGGKYSVVALFANAAPQASAENDWKAAIRKFMDTAIPALAAIANVHTPDEIDALDAIPREPVIDQVRRLSHASEELSRLVPSEQTQADKDGGQQRAAEASAPNTAKETADKILRERMAPISEALGLDVMIASAGNGVIQIFTFKGGPLVYTIRADGTAIQRVSWNQPDAPDTLTVDQVEIITQAVSETQPEPQPARAAVAGEVVGWAAVPSRGKRAGRIYCTCDTREQIDAYIEQVHQSNDSLTLWARPLSFADAAPQASAEAFDFVAHLARQAEFSARTFGPGARVAGVCDHIRKELIEVETSGGDLKEWVDVIILGLDGAWRSGATPQEIIAAIVAKQAKNEARTWPDWRTVDPSKAIEHDRGGQP
ncbi:dATP/dGTP pyrophosphohydrolase domain-containing protein [Achromobacter xylosoxidans]